MNRKVTVVGAGNVGATLAQRLVDQELADVVLIDIVEGMPQGKGLDIMQATPVEGSDSRVIGTNDYRDTAGSDVVVITAGIARKPGMSRDDLLNTNYKIVKECTENAVKHSPSCVLIVVSATPSARAACRPRCWARRGAPDCSPIRSRRNWKTCCANSPQITTTAWTYGGRIPWRAISSFNSIADPRNIAPR